MRQPPETRRVLLWTRLVGFALVLTAMFAAFPGRGATFDVSLDRDTVAIGDVAKLTLTFGGDGRIQVSPLPHIPGLVISGPQQQQQTVTVNNKTETTISAIYYLRPTETNVFTIPALTASIGGEILTSKPVQLHVVNAVTSQSAQAQGAPSLAQLRMIVPKEQLYVGEPVVVQLQLLLNRAVSDVSEFEFPSLAGDGWYAGKPVQGDKRQVRMGNDLMIMVPWEVPLTPLKAGTLELGPVNSSMVVKVPVRGRRGNDPFDFDPFGMFTQTEARRAPLTLPGHPIEVLPLPTNNVPPSFNGAVGQFDMTVSAGPTNVTVGDPITVKIEITGRGNLNSVSAPTNFVHGDFKAYPPTTRLDTTDQLGFAGTQTFEQVLIPENTDVSSLPSIAFSYFDPDSATYHTLSHPATKLIVRPAGATPLPSIAATTSGAQSATKPKEELVHIMPRLGTLLPPKPQTILQPATLAWNLVPALMWLGVVVWRKRSDALARNPRLRRRQEVKRLVIQSLEDLRRLSVETQSDEFFATVFRLLQEQIGATLDLPASAITEEVVDDRLLRLGLSDDTRSNLHELFQACDAARYAPIRDAQELARFVPLCESALQELQEVNA